MVLSVFKVIATSGFLTALRCTKFVFGRGCGPTLYWGSLKRFPDPLAGLIGPTSKADEQGRGKGKKGNKGLGTELGDPLPPPPAQILGAAP